MAPPGRCKTLKTVDLILTPRAPVVDLNRRSAKGRQRAQHRAVDQS